MKTAYHEYLVLFIFTVFDSLGMDLLELNLKVEALLSNLNALNSNIASLHASLVTLVTACGRNTSCTSKIPMLALFSTEFFSTVSL